MKKIISVLLSVLMIFSIFSVAASAEGDELVITVANDIHYNCIRNVGKHNSISEDFAHVNSAGRLYFEADAIFKAFLKEAAASESDCLFFVGDITETGTPAQVEAMTGLLAEFEATTGKKVFVVPGNHDVLNNTKAQFMSDYADFGYSEALEIDDKSASYVVDLNDEYRLIAIDATTCGTGAHSVYEERLEWIADQGEKAKAAGKHLIAMHHQNFIDHMILSSVIQPGGVVTAKNEGAIDVYAKAGIKYEGTPEQWETAQKVMGEILDDLGIEYNIGIDEAAFYGPKLDIQYKNVFGKEDTIVTIQIDMLLAQKFGMEYTDSDGQKKTPYIIHRTSLGCYERTLAYLIERYAGALPLWMMPTQVKVLPITDRAHEYGKDLTAKLNALNIHAETDCRSEKLGYKIREAQMQKIPYMLVIGDRDMENGTVSVRTRKGDDLGAMTPDEFMAKCLMEIATKSKDV